jgi:pSer/pThr/pTyr-binding forkhead associated (FHA) protein
MPVRLVALDDGPDIVLDQEMVVVGRHPSCDARLDSPRLSRHHCCLMIEEGEIVVQDLGSTNGIRINGQRVKTGCLRVGDVLSIAHFRYRVDHVPRLRRADLSHLRATDYLFTGSRFGFISRN